MLLSNEDVVRGCSNFEWKNPENAAVLCEYDHKILPSQMDMI